MLIFVFLFLFSFSEQSLIPDLLDVTDLLNNTCPKSAENIDEVAAQLFPFGDPCHSFPIDTKTAADLCAKYKNWTGEVDVQLTSWLIRFGITSMYNFTAQTVCRLYEENSDKMIEFAKEVNSKAAKLNPARERILDLFYAFSKVLTGNHICLTRNGFAYAACLFLKWSSDTIIELSESSQVIAKQIFETYIKLGTTTNPLTICANLPPRLTDTRFESIDMNYVISTKNCLVSL